MARGVHPWRSGCTCHGTALFALPPSWHLEACALSMSLDMAVCLEDQSTRTGYSCFPDLTPWLGTQRDTDRVVGRL